MMEYYNICGENSLQNTIVLLITTNKNSVWHILTAPAPSTINRAELFSYM